MINLMDEYMKSIKVNMTQFLKVCLETKYVKKIADDFIDKYLEIRYYGLIEAKKGLTVKNKLLTEFKKLKEELINEDSKKTKNIELTYIFFDRCMAFNEKTDKEEILDEVNLTINLRKEHLGLNDENEFREKINHEIIEAELAKEKVLEKAESDKFYLRFSNFKTTTLKKVNLKYNIKFPSIYSNDSISKVFNSGTINEDKLFVEFYLIASQIIKDIEGANYRKQYVVDIVDSILEKPQKLARLMEIVRNSSIQDRLLLNINHDVLNKSKDEVYELLRSGYKIVLTVDDDFVIDEASIQRLGIYQYVLVDSTSKCYSELIKNKVKNLIEI